jgi:iron-sulfur cluster assembly protein
MTITTAKPRAKGIKMTESALQEMLRLRAEKGTDLSLRLGLKGGGCSGLSYTMDFEEPDKVTPKDEVFDYEDGFRLVIDKKSLLFLYGLELDFSDDLLAGGFKFNNPNAQRSCSCGASFAV